MISHTTTVRVHYADTDQMGVVYHGNYARYLEIGRTEWLRCQGITYKDIEQKGILLPVVSLECRFKKSAFYDQEITIKTTLKDKPTFNIVFDYQIINQNKEVITTANTALIFVNKKTRKPMRCPNFILDNVVSKSHIDENVSQNA